MSRAKGTPKTGGRAKGTPNKITGTLKDFVSGLIDDNREQMQYNRKNDLCNFSKPNVQKS